MAMLADGGPVAKAPSSTRKIFGTVAGLAAVIVVMLCAFALPAVHSKVKDVPVTVVGAAQERGQLIAALDKAGFDTSLSGSETAGVQKILDRKAYGAFVIGSGGLVLDTSSAASYTVSTALTQMATELGAAMKVQVTVHDVRSFTTDDPKGAGLSAGALPIALGGWIAAVGIISLVVGTRQRLLAAAAFSVVGGFALTGVLYGIGTFEGSYWATSAAAMLGIAATAFLVLGLERSLRGIGIAIAAVVLILLGNPLSGLSSAPELLPHPFGTLGQLLPPGATGALLRNVSFFDGAAIARPIIVLCCWFAVGLVAFFLGGLREGRKPSASNANLADLDAFDAALVTGGE